ncbi:hypothetical protein BJ138DRAFT_1135262 [Hygrophoropsis aurantiaca]|uniref:Uncharacterized protein n=1 Tax=Hygrophoropsis aurantiaca TaxID=72124 RepID=A0ACB8AGD8_9AGAM|nr:hypothetical protein BJ138DRAFT_1135262 [Hygrophoropsis aurantiaca]
MTRTAENKSGEKERRKPGRVPCETCIKRGCGAICPNGMVLNGWLVLANTQELHNKIEVMGTRIRDLEEALASAHAEVYDIPHPLLSESISDIHREKGSASPQTQAQVQNSGSSPSVIDGDNDPEGVIDAFGTLTIGTRGETLFMGSSARSEPLLKKTTTLQPILPRLSKQIMDAWIPESELVPIDNSLRKSVMALLPPLSEAIRLCDIYLEWGKTLWNPLSRSALLDDILASVYRADRSYVFIGLAVKLSYRVYLHSARWKLSNSVTQHRSSVFYQLFLIDTWLSFYAGRPPTVSPDFIDCPYPDDEFAVVGQNGEKEMSWHMWSWKYTRLLHQVITTAFGARPPAFSTILELDRKIRDFPVPKHLQPCCTHDTSPSAMPEHIQVHSLLIYKEVTLLNLHRSYFAQALQDSPNDLLKHRYGPSVMAAYRSAWRIIEIQSHSVKVFPQIIERMGVFWSHALSAAVVMCMIVTRAPGSSMAAPSLHELDTIYKLFEQSAPTAKPAAVLLESVTKLWRKGHEATSNPNSNSGDLSSAELDRLGGGKTHLISRTSPSSSSHSSPASTSTPSTSSIPTPPTSEPDSAIVPLWDGLDPANDIHPRIMHDMRVFDGFDAPQYATADNFDFVGQESFFSAMSDVQFTGHNMFGPTNEIYSAPTRIPSFPQVGHPPYIQEAAPVMDAPVLDAAWQSFVEQLGF